MALVTKQVASLLAQSVGARCSEGGGKLQQLQKRRK